VLARRNVPPEAVPLPRLSGWLGLGAFCAFLVIGLATRLASDPARTTAGALIALAAAIPLFLLRAPGAPRASLTLALAAASTVGVVLIGNGDSRVIGWMMVVVMAGWCVLAGGIPVGVVYGAASILLFGAEWLWAVRDPGWGPWSAGVIVAVLGAALIQHQLVLVERLHAAQAGLAERSRAEERNRIARDLHDVIAHSLTVSLLHVTSARLAVEHDPADAVRALAEAERLCRQSLAEVRATMGLLRSDPAEGIAAPVPGIDQVPRLVEQVRGAGADVSLVVDGDVRGLPATTGSTVYRIVQEGLTNASKHAPGAPVVVQVAIQNGQVDVSVDSAGPPGQGFGLGVLSMRERAQAVGGTCTAGPGGRGWLVHACLPAQARPGLDGQ
jgi:signal transduction histidine kinase